MSSPSCNFFIDYAFHICKHNQLLQAGFVPDIAFRVRVRLPPFFCCDSKQRNVQHVRFVGVCIPKTLQPASSFLFRTLSFCLCQNGLYRLRIRKFARTRVAEGLHRTTGAHPETLMTWVGTSCREITQDIGIFFEEQNIDTLKNDSELYLVIYAGFAQSESESISKHITWTYRKNFEDGKVSFQYKRLLGYRKGEDAKPEIVPEEAAIVERIFEMFLAGQPVGLIAQTLQSEKIEIPGKDLSFSKNMIMNILRNEKYCGDCILQKTVTVDCISKTRKANQGEAPMYLVENSHPAIISHDLFHRTQEELVRRKALRLKSEKTAITKTGKYSKYALSEVLHCAECGSRYKRVTWNIRGKKKIVWRCVSRLDYGKKYCKDSVTVEEAALHGAVVRALNRFHAEDESTYLTLMKATIGEAIGINGGSEEIDLLTRRIDALNKRMLELVNETVATGKDVESSEDEFKGISDQIEQLNRRIAAIQESIHKDGSRQARLEEIQNIIAERNANETQYDDSIVRQMIECIKVHNDGKLTIIFGGGYEIEETL